MSLLIDQAEKIFFEAYRTQGWEFALTEPLWLTWTLERFGELECPLHAHLPATLKGLEGSAAHVPSQSTPWRPFSASTITSTIDLLSSPVSSPRPKHHSTMPSSPSRTGRISREVARDGMAYKSGKSWSNLSLPDPVRKGRTRANQG